MTTLVDKAILSSADNRPSMLEKDIYDSWKSIMKLYMMNRQYGRMIFESVENGPLIWPSIKENRVTRPKNYFELYATEAIQVDYDVKATNIILQGLPPELYAYLGKHEFHANEVRLMHERNSDPLALVATHRMTQITFQPVQGRQISFASGTSKTYTPKTSGSNSGKQRTVICYNCKGEGHMSKQCTKTKRKQDDSWFKDKVLMVKAQANGQIQHEEELSFLADLRIAKVALMANLSHYGSDALAEIFYDHTTKQGLSFQNPFYLKKAQELEPKLYDGNVIEKTSAIVIPDTEETLMLAEESRSNMLLKQKGPMIPTIVEVPKELPKASMVNMSLKKLKHHLAGFDVVVKERTTAASITKGSWGSNIQKLVLGMKENSVINQSDLSFDQLFVSNELKSQSQEKNAVIKKLKERIKSLSALNDDLRKHKGKALADDVVTSYFSAPEMLKVDVEPLAPKLLNNKTVHSDYLRHTQEQAVILREVFEQGKSQNPLNNSLDHVVGVTVSASGSESQPSGNTKKDKIQRAPRSTQKNKVEAHPRTSKSSLKNKNCVVKPKGTASMQHSMINANSKLICVKCNACMLSDNHDLSILNDVNARAKSKSFKKNLNKKVWKPTGKVITTSTEMPSRKPDAIETDTPKPVVTLVYSRKPKKSKCTDNVSKSKVIKFVPANKNKPSKSWGSKVYNVPSSFVDAEAVATACYTQNRSIIRLCHGKTPYEFLHDKLPDLSFFHVFGALCYPINDSENLGKLQPKANIGIFIGYAPTKKAFRIYNQRTRRIIKTIHVDFYELTVMASEHRNSGPTLHEMTPTTISSGLVPNTPPSTLVDHPAREVIALIAEVGAPEPAASTGSPSSTTVDQDAPAPSNSQTTPQTQSPIIPNDFKEDNHDLDVAHMNNNPLFCIPIPKFSSDQSSSTDIVHTIVHPDHQFLNTIANGLRIIYLII
uniref:Integrase, catalytic region, zinc finger, CCHC-type, peptidase aspartic, catalytic n=1 Tax=Tanacetum cinerariifolium TaxID=118510 RepID=A0A6L2JL89_TANCI|nr:integrase, catalytic region, zinc finger, CCHC-type, peptidase aspartic, catalytic [Tanacetum cinerariifolium]